MRPCLVQLLSLQNIVLHEHVQSQKLACGTESTSAALSAARSKYGMLQGFGGGMLLPGSLYTGGMRGLSVYELRQHVVDMCWAHSRQGFRVCCSSAVSREAIVHTVHLKRYHTCHTSSVGVCTCPVMAGKESAQGWKWLTQKARGSRAGLWLLQEASCQRHWHQECVTGASLLVAGLA